jgi:uncharacterized delta-60 repeat protein
MRNLLTSIVLAALCTTVSAQSWVARYDGPASDEDQPCGIAVDDSGYVYVTGSSWGNGTSHDFATVKYGTSGETLWVRRFDGPASGDDQAGGIAVSGDRVAVTGGVAGPDLYTDLCIVVYSTDGDSLWTASYDGPGSGNDQGLAVAFGNSGDVYVTGYSSDTLNGWDYLTAKYNASGVQQWTARLSTEYEDYAVAIEIDEDGDCYVTGNSGSPYFLTWDYVTVRYSTDGAEQWASRYEGPAFEDDEARAIAIDSDGNAYVTGGSRDSTTGPDFTTIKYSPTGDSVWIRRYDGPAGGTDEANDLALDVSGNVYVTGFSQDTATDYDFATVKYSTDGALQWVARYDGPVHEYDEARAIAVDDRGGIFVTGTSTGDGTRGDFATVKYSPSGAQVWVHRYDGPASRLDEPVAVALDGRGGVCVTGGSAGDGTVTDYATIRYLASGIEEGTCPTAARPAIAARFVRNVLSQPATAAGTTLLDATGSRVMELSPGTNDISSLSPGIYFARSKDDGPRSSITRIVVAR